MSSKDRANLISSLVQQLDDEPIWLRYRAKIINASPLVGWAARLNGYFWPSPSNGFAASEVQLAPILSEGEALAKAERPWSKETQERAMVFAQKVFKWGGVKQRDVTWELIDLVVQAALTENATNGAPMNSGWTKIAAFVTDHLEPENRSQAIWDSRVSWSLVRRFDRILCESKSDKIPNCLAHLGKVPARVVTRWNPPPYLPWPNAYQKWQSHFAASSLIRDIRDHLNYRGLLAPTPTGGTTPWTVRTVEMVLFMDGY